jgi:hypothetical protein
MGIKIMFNGERLIFKTNVFLRYLAVATSLIINNNKIYNIAFSCLAGSLLKKESFFEKYLSTLKVTVNNY